MGFPFERHPDGGSVLGLSLKVCVVEKGRVLRSLLALDEGHWDSQAGWSRAGVSKLAFKEGAEELPAVL